MGDSVSIMVIKPHLPLLIEECSCISSLHREDGTMTNFYFSACHPFTPLTTVKTLHIINDTI